MSFYGIECSRCGGRILPGDGHALRHEREDVAELVKAARDVVDVGFPTHECEHLETIKRLAAALEPFTRAASPTHRSGSVCSPDDICARCGHARDAHVPGEHCWETYSVYAPDEDGGFFEDDWVCDCPEFVSRAASDPDASSQ